MQVAAESSRSSFIVYTRKLKSQHIRVVRDLIDLCFHILLSSFYSLIVYKNNDNYCYKFQRKQEKIQYRVMAGR